MPYGPCPPTLRLHLSSKELPAPSLPVVVWSSKCVIRTSVSVDLLVGLLVSPLPLVIAPKLGVANGIH